MTGIYDPSGAYRVTAVDGQTFTGIYAPDGSYNVVIQNQGDSVDAFSVNSLVVNDVAEVDGFIDVIDDTTTEPRTQYSLGTDSFPRLTVGLDSSDVPTISAGPGTGAQDTFLKRITTGVMGLINGTSAMGLYIYNTFTSGSNFERGFARWASNIFEIGNETTGGTLRTVRIIGASLNIFAGGSSRLTFGSSGVTPTTDAAYALGAAATRFLRLHLSPTAFASLPSAATAGSGAVAICSDCNSTTFNATAAGGGANVMLVHSDGTNWKIG